MENLILKEKNQSSEVILKVRGLSVELEGEKILENLSFEIKKGEILTILGPNGAGKTVLLRTLLGVLPYKGEIIWSPPQGLKIGYVPQRLPFIKDVPMNGKEFFSLKNVLENDLVKILNLLGIEKEILEKKIGELSSGQFQRLLIGWALSGNPQVLLFDEPTSGIDISGEKTIYSLLKQFQKERDLTILLVTHDLNVVYKYSSKVLCLNKRALCFGKLREILTPDLLEKVYGTEIKFYEHKH